MGQDLQGYWSVTCPHCEKRAPINLHGRHRCGCGEEFHTRSISIVTKAEVDPQTVEAAQTMVTVVTDAGGDISALGAFAVELTAKNRIFRWLLGDAGDDSFPNLYWWRLELRRRLSEITGDDPVPEEDSP